MNVPARFVHYPMLWLLGGMAWLLQPATAQPTPPGDTALAAKIRRIESGLLPTFRIAGKPSVRFALTDRMRYHGVAGFSIAVINNGVVEWATAYGVREAATNVPVTPETVFQAGSISKPVTALAALSLVEQGLLTLDGDLNDKLQSWKIPDNRFTKIQKITLRRALSHNVGLVQTGLNAAAGYASTDSLPTITQLLRGEPPANTGAVVVVGTPGTNPQVSSEGYCIIQQAMMDLTGQAFAPLMANRVLSRIPMPRSTFEQHLPTYLRANAATGHNKGKPLPGQWKRHPAMAAAGLWSTPTDVAHLMIELMQTLAGQPHRIIAKPWIDSLLTPQRGNEMRGLGYYVHGKGPTRCFYHRGWNLGYTSYSIAFPGLNKGLVMMTNADGEGYPFMMEVLRAVAQEYDWPADLPVEAAPQKQTVVIRPDSTVIDQFVGRYLLANKQFGEVTRHNDGQLYLTIGDRPSVRLQAETDFDYVSDDGLELLFAIERGVLTGLLFKDPINRHLAERVYTPPTRTQPTTGKPSNR